jgi:hypothetical protein
MRQFLFALFSSLGFLTILHAQNNFISIDQEYQNRAMISIKNHFRGSIEFEVAKEKITNDILEYHPEYPGDKNEFALRRFTKKFKEELPQMIEKYAYSFYFEYPVIALFEEYHFESNSIQVDLDLAEKDGSKYSRVTGGYYPTRGNRYLDRFKMNEDDAEAIITSLNSKRELPAQIKVLLYPKPNNKWGYTLLSVSFFPHGKPVMSHEVNDLPNIFLVGDREVFVKDYDSAYANMRTVATISPEFPVQWVDPRRSRALKSGIQYQAQRGALRNKLTPVQYNLEQIHAKILQSLKVPPRSFIGLKDVDHEIVTQQETTDHEYNFVVIPGKGKEKVAVELNNKFFYEPLQKLSPGKVSYYYSSPGTIISAVAKGYFNIPDDKNVVLVTDWNKFTVSTEKLYYLPLTVDLRNVNIDNIIALGGVEANFSKH